jgi:hypothetical protein
MKALLIAALLLIAGCVPAKFEPQTMEGGQCKADCAHEMQMCNGPSYTCDRSYTLCIDACIDLDVIARKNGQQ